MCFSHFVELLVYRALSVDPYHRLPHTSLRSPCRPFWTGDFGRSTESRVHLIVGLKWMARQRFSQLDTYFEDGHSDLWFKSRSRAFGNMLLYGQANRLDFVLNAPNPQVPNDAVERRCWNRLGAQVTPNHVPYTMGGGAVTRTRLWTLK